MHKYTKIGKVTSKNTNIDTKILIVRGGGGGGQVIIGSNLSIPMGEYKIYVGAGGEGGFDSTQGTGY